ncbi:MAG TPA: DegT/DnrJ/EryC1/StrS family aminotransferase [Candidatus Hypogeohydataceae bacterium YC40]
MKVPFIDLQAQYATIKDGIQLGISEVLASQDFILGKQVAEFEINIAHYCGIKRAIGVASGTDALLLSMMALDIKQGDEVITTPYTFFATVGSIVRLGAVPVFVDIDPKTFNIDNIRIEEKITPRTRAIIPVHLFGQMADMGTIMELAKKYNIAIIEDAAQAIGATYNGLAAGSMGDLGILSFYPSKNLGAYGDAGMVLTNNEELAEKVSILRVHGSKTKYYHTVVGINSRLDTLQAAILLVKLKHLDVWKQRRQEIALLYDQDLLDTPVICPNVSEQNDHVYTHYVIRTKERDALKSYLTEAGIGTAIYYPLPMHRQACFGYLNYRDTRMPEAERASKETLAIPLYPAMTEEQRKYVVENIKKFFYLHPELQ